MKKDTRKRRRKNMAGQFGRPSVVKVETAPFHDLVTVSAAQAAAGIERRNGEAVATAGADTAMSFAISVANSLSDSPKWLDCRYLYDINGSRIFERICEQPEYYLTRTEGAILAAVGLDIALRTGNLALIELGSGSSVKTRLLLEAYCELYGEICYTPVDVSRPALDHALEVLNDTFPEVRVDPLHGTYEEAFPLLGERSPLMLLFLGSTLGNLNQQEEQVLWSQISAGMSPGDYLLLGIDINSDEDRINAAYNDAAGWSSAFTRNLFERMNRELGSNLDVTLIDHVASFNPGRSRVEIFARFLEEQSVGIDPLDHGVKISAGEMILTEISRKFRLLERIPYLQRFGFDTLQVYTDNENLFAVLLLRRR
jgi:L-histidine N-alpha-methyltransferase